jgi:chlorobactene glucosyltransferase
VHLLVWIYHIAVTSVLAAVLLALVVNMGFLRRLRPGTVPVRRPLVSVLIPARNEADRIGPCLHSLVNQDYPNIEILVLDDYSEDGTAQVVKRFTQVLLLAGEPLPKGWTGKSWACHQLANAARGKLLLFTDADTVHSVGAVSAAVREQQRTRADLLSIWPCQISETLVEKLVIPLMYVVGGSFVPHWLIYLCQTAKWLFRNFPEAWVASLGIANGQFLLFSKESYFRIGGHQAVRDKMAEDVALARTIAGQIGMRLVNANGVLLVQCRMYRSLEEMWHGFTKNLRPVFERGSLDFFIAVTGQFLVFVFPFALMILSPSPASLVEVCIIYGMRLLAAARYHSSWLSVLLHPIGYGFALIIALNSLRQVAGKGVTWKGRLYKPGSRVGMGAHSTKPRSSQGRLLEDDDEDDIGVQPD